MKTTIGILLVTLLALSGIASTAQQNVSGGGAVSIVQGGNTAIVTAAGAQKVDGSAVTQPVSGPLTDAQLRATPVPISGTVTSSMGALVNGTANIGIVRTVPSSCTQATPFANTTAQVATGAGTTVTTTTLCVTFAYANNITNAPVTLRLADRQGTPVIWFGGNADFSIPANSNIRIPIDGVTFTSGMTAIAGTASAVNLQINGVQ